MLWIRILNRSFFVFWIFLYFHSEVKGQALAPDTTCIDKDLPELIREALGKDPKPKEIGANSLLVVPIIGSNPATGFMVGLGGQFAFKMSETNLYSLISGSLQATTKDQYIFTAKNSIYTKREKLFFTGDWRYMIFSQSTYGLGTNAPKGGILDYQFSLGGSETDIDSLAQPMTFNFARFHQSVGFKLRQGIYLGLGYHFDSYFKIVDQKLNLDPENQLLTSHYVYSMLYSFNAEKYYSSAMFGNFIIDKRDNMIQPYKGYFLSLGFRGAYRVFGNKSNAEMFSGEWRSFHNLSKKNPAHLIGFWLLGDLTPEGDFPYMILPATAFDQRGRSGRGYTQGRFRGNNYLYGETEYRFPISKCGGILGGVLFVNGTTATNAVQQLKMFESVKVGYGIGLRVKIDKNSRTNLVLDYGRGEQSSGFYLAISETF
ncbi:BamA/TamA family outer membrane protein [Pararhodonellum marinum]|uniref:BamA/TamA family outer membrane protein n=1 Tax=Pararhodonellum marinum TaxID=2755358 RepID=UPI00188FF5EC|nr:BamA/TamA family outer membrane protein [Pararhodonellum marinum]